MARHRRLSANSFPQLGPRGEPDNCTNATCLPTPFSKDVKAPLWWIQRFQPRSEKGLVLHRYPDGITKGTDGPLIKTKRESVQASKWCFSNGVSFFSLSVVPLSAFARVHRHSLWEFPTLWPPKPITILIQCCSGDLLSRSLGIFQRILKGFCWSVIKR